MGAARRFQPFANRDKIATVTGGLIPTAQWWGVEIKNVPSASAWTTAASHSALSSSVRLARILCFMTPIREAWDASTEANWEKHVTPTSPARRKPIEVSGKPALLVFERRKGTDVVDAMLFVKRRNWFGAHNFSPAGVDFGIADVWIDHTDGRLDHVTAIVDLCDDAVRLVLAIQANCSAGPLSWPIISTRLVSKHVAVTIGVLAGHNDARLVRLFAA